MSGAPQLMSCVLVALAITVSLYQVVEGIDIKSSVTVDILNYRGGMEIGSGEGPCPDTCDTAKLGRLCSEANPGSGYSNCRVVTYNGEPRNAIICTENIALIPEKGGKYTKISFGSIKVFYLDISLVSSSQAFMALLRSLYDRSTGYDLPVNYDSILDRIRCISCEVSHYDDPRLFTCAFASKRNHGHILASTRENGEVVITNTKLLRLGSDDYYETSRTHDNAVYSMAWSGTDMKLVTASGDHSARLWNVDEDGKLELLDTYAYHGRSIKTVCFKQHSSHVFATGGFDSNIFVWDVRTVNKTPDQHIYHCHGDGNIMSLKFQDDMKIISCGNKDSSIKVWDLRKTYLRTRHKSKPLHEILLPNKFARGYNHLVVNKNATKLYARCFDSNIYCFNIVNYSPIPECTFLGHKGTDRYDKMSLSPDEKYLASTGKDVDDSKIFIWRTDTPEEPLVKLCAKELSGLSDVSWCPEDELLLASSSDDHLPWLWSVPCASDRDPDENENKAPSSQSTGNDSDERSCVQRVYVKKYDCKRISAMAKTFERIRRPVSELGTLPALPEGRELHVCVPIGKSKQVTWLRNTEEKPATLKPKRRTGNKRKSSELASPCGNLYDYFNKRPR